MVASGRSAPHGCPHGSRWGATALGTSILTPAPAHTPNAAPGTMLAEIARATHAYDDFKTVMIFVWRSVQNQGILW